jgi:hypothetical protein
MQPPETLAQEILKTLADADENTTHAAIEIVCVLLRHRRTAQTQFEQECQSAELKARLGGSSVI